MPVQPTTGFTDVAAVGGSAMKVKVTLFIAGRIIEEVVDAVDYKDAQEIAKRRNSDKATIVSVTAIF